MRADFHVHSKASDGDYLIDELVLRAKENNLQYFALTDHNKYSLMDIDVNQLDCMGVKIIPSVEFDVERDVENGTKMHILGLNIDVNNAKLHKYFDKYHHKNRKKVDKCYKKLHKIYGLKVSDSSLERTSKLSYWGILGKFAYKLREQGLTQKSHYDAVEEIAYCLKKRDSNFHNEKEIIKLILQAGGVPVLAHPCSLKLSDGDLDEKVAYLVSLGLKGIEIYHPNIKKEQTKYYQLLADKYKLYTSGGSDFHRYNEREDVFVSDKGKNKVTIFEAIKDIKSL